MRVVLLSKTVAEPVDEKDMLFLIFKHAAPQYGTKPMIAGLALFKQVAAGPFHITGR